MLQFLDEKGLQTQHLPDWADVPTLIQFYKNMVRARSFDQKAIALQRTGKLGTYASILGQEAIGVGYGSAMATEDVLVPYYRDQAAQFIRGVSFVEMLLYWGGDERGNKFAVCQEDFPNCVPIATQATHACGIASAFKIRGEHRVAVTSCGDGATSKGDFMESLNLAGAWQLPVVFMVNNNQWAISTPRNLQCGNQVLADKAIAAGFEGIQVDGNDVIAVYHAAKKAMEHARSGKGPLLIECITYRLGDHTTADDASRYRDAEAVKQAWENEPIKRLQSFLHEKGYWNEVKERELQLQYKEEVENAVEEYLNTEPEPPEAMLDSLYETLPAAYKQQRQQLINRCKQRKS
ncbi:MAG: pyruvate dehydrogenase (acetyl-transferring) E1 component subunit alpha [Cellvibrionaceae bacterium]